MIATACLLGVPAERLVYGDMVERLYWSRVLVRVIELHSTQRDNQAVSNANAVGEMLRRMFRGRRRA